MPAHSAAATRTPRGIRFAAVTTDRGIVARQIGREPRAFRRVAVRCPFGKPAVTEQAPFDDAGAPFPTTFWLTCPYLVTQVSRIEAASGVERWTRAVRDDPALARSLARADEEQRSLRPQHEGGIGGAGRDAASLKCLHAHVAFALARPRYEL